MSHQATVRWAPEDLVTAEALATAMRRVTGRNVTRAEVLRQAARQGFALLRAQVGNEQNEESKS